MNVVVLAKFSDTAEALSQQRAATVKVKHELNTSSKRLQELSEQKVNIESSLRAERLKAEEVKQENKRLKQDLHSKRQAEAQAKVAAVKPAPVQSAPVKQVAPATGDCSIVNNYNWDKRVAYGVCMAESGGNPNAANLNDNHGSCVGSYGLMQVACVHGGVFTDPKQNMDKAFEIYSRSGWQPWGAYINGSYAKYL